MKAGSRAGPWQRKKETDGLGSRAGIAPRGTRGKIVGFAGPSVFGAARSATSRKCVGARGKPGHSVGNRGGNGCRRNARGAGRAGTQPFDSAN